jgi:hypothetical protein
MRRCHSMMALVRLYLDEQVAVGAIRKERASVGSSLQFPVDTFNLLSETTLRLLLVERTEPREYALPRCSLLIVRQPFRSMVMPAVRVRDIRFLRFRCMDHVSPYIPTDENRAI